MTRPLPAAWLSSTAAILLVTAIALIMAAIAQVFTADVVKPHSAFIALLVSSLLTGVAAYMIDVRAARV